MCFAQYIPDANAENQAPFIEINTIWQGPFTQCPADLNHPVSLMPWRMIDFFFAHVSMRVHTQSQMNAHECAHTLHPSHSAVPAKFIYSS